jgi:signal transduction histidine kinase
MAAIQSSPADGAASRGSLRPVGLAVLAGLWLLLDGGVPASAAWVLALIFGGLVGVCLRISRQAARRNAALATARDEAWTIAAEAREELHRAQDRYDRIVKDLKEARDEAIAANHTRAMFVAGMSHELRTPLNAIIGFSEVLEMELFGSLGSPRNLEYVRDIKGSGQHLLSLINDILDMSKIDAGKMSLHEDMIDLAHLITACCRVMRPRAEDGGVELAVSLPEGQPLYVRGDEVRLKQVLFNLLSNAIKFTHAGGRILVRAEEWSGRHVAITVEDTGIGIRPEHLALVFEPFRQVDDSLTRQVGGTGLGLPLTRALVEMHGGELRLSSVEGQGTAVTVILPNLVVEPVTTTTATPVEGPERVLSWLSESI